MAMVMIVMVASMFMVGRLLLRLVDLVVVGVPLLERVCLFLVYVIQQLIGIDEIVPQDLDNLVLLL